MLVWAVLVLSAAALHVLLGRRLWRRFRSLGSEIGAATDRLAEVSDRLAELQSPRETAGSGPSA